MDSPRDHRWEMRLATFIGKEVARPVGMVNQSHLRRPFRVIAGTMAITVALSTLMLLLPALLVLLVIALVREYTGW